MAEGGILGAVAEAAERCATLFLLDPDVAVEVSNDQRQAFMAAIQKGLLEETRSFLASRG
jgi:hypothetical protein